MPLAIVLLVRLLLHDRGKAYREAPRSSTKPDLDEATTSATMWRL